MKSEQQRKVILTKGLPGSGKSTWAKQWAANRGDEAVRINKDELRAMLHGSRYSSDNEDLVEKVRDAAILAALVAGRDVVVDDTNLALRHQRHIRKLTGTLLFPVKVEIQDFTGVPIEVCIERDALRQRSVGEQVIRTMAKRHRVSAAP